MKTGKYIPLGTYNDVKIGYGTVDFKNLKTIYLKLNSWLQAENEYDDFDSVIHKTRRKIKEIVYNLKNPMFKQQSIVDLDIRTKGIKLDKKSFMNLEVTLYVDSQFDVKSKITKETIKNIIKISKEPISLETPVGDSNDASIKDFIESENEFSPSDIVANTDLKEKVREVLKSLTPREEKVLKMRFGIDVASEHTLEEVGKDFSVTRERIRQIEVKALKKLKHPSRSKKLQSFFEKEFHVTHEEDDDTEDNE